MNGSHHPLNATGDPAPWTRLRPQRTPGGHRADTGGTPGECTGRRRRDEGRIAVQMTGECRADTGQRPGEWPGRRRADDGRMAGGPAVRTAVWLAL